MDYGSPIEALRRHWGYDSFRPLQEEIIDSVLSGADTLALMPTGGGKSITFQVPGLMLGGLTIVVTPLISLMKDQVDNLRARGVDAVCIHSGLTRAESRLAMQKAELGKVKFLYLSPERLGNERFIGEAKNWDVSLIVVDEAHCISQWGYDFRPSYLGIAELRKHYPGVPVLALTASATARVAADICRNLEFREGHREFRMSFARPNISYIVRRDVEKTGRLLRVLGNTSGAAIVYVRSRAKTGELAKVIQSAGISALGYHAGLTAQEKNERQQQWKEGGARVMVATNAFGMGIDKPDVRVVVHYDLPSSPEEYYQEAGRAGRDGKPSFAVCLVSPTDRGVLGRRLADAFPPREYIAEIYDKACVDIDLAMGEGYNKVFDFNAEEFCRRHKLWPAAVRSALQMLGLSGYVEYVEDTDARARVMMTCRRDELYDMNFSRREDEVTEYLLRNYPGLFADYVNISEPLIASHLGISADDVYHTLVELTRKHAVHYVPRREQPYLYFPSRRIQSKYIEISREVYDLRRERMKERIEAMLSLAFGQDNCRANTILRYFGEEPQGRCGVCDVCRAEARAPRGEAGEEEKKRIVHAVGAAGRLTLAELAETIGSRPEAIVETVRALTDREKLKLNPDQTLSIPPCKHP